MSDAPVTTPSGRNPMISVIIPCFNHSQYLGEAIESALNQDYQPVEVIVIDDGSTDPTASVASGYAGIRYVFQANAGLASARNRGLKLSHGNYLVFLDADDRLCDGALRRGAEYLQANPECGFVYGRFRFINESGLELASFDQPPDNPDTYLGLFGGNHIAMCATVLYRRTVIEELRGFRTDLKAAEDYEIYFRIARRYPYRRHDYLVAECRRHSSNMSSRPALMLVSTLRVVRSQRPYCTDEAHRRAYKSGLRLWRQYYGAMLLSQLRLEIERKQPASALRSLMVILTVAPHLLARKIVRNLIPIRLRGRFRRALLMPAVRRRTPLSRDFGFDRGTPIDRYYIEQFLAMYAQDISGDVLEVKDSTYTRTFGRERVSRRDVLDIDPQNALATIVADLTREDLFGSETHDCVILTQTLQLLYDPGAAVRTVHKILRRGGVVLATVPGISQTARDGFDRWSDYWRFTAASAVRIFGDVFGAENVNVQTRGNLAAAIAFLRGAAANEIDDEGLDFSDPDYPVLVVIRAAKL
ncbi:MAG TPA: glycosyltransferase [Bryobacteraceae bacterium]|nr:glycosyltransferase [Bryobacteraceae bacterium]